MGIVAKYKFNQTTYENFIPKFNSTFTNYTITDEIDTDGFIIRTIESDGLPTEISFGTTSSTKRAKSLLEVFECNTDKITNMNYMFSNCSSLTSLNLSSFNTEKVTDMTGMFYNCSGLTSLNLSSFNTEKVTSMDTMFQNCSNLTSLDLSNFNTQSVTNMSSVFCDCSNLTSLDLSNFNTEKVTIMNHMFQSCSSLTSLNISSFNTQNVKSMNSMFKACSNLTSLDLRNWVTNSATTMQGMFHSCFSLTEIKGIENFNVSSVQNFGAMFYSCLSLTELDLRNWVTSSATTFQSMFDNCTNLEVIRVDNFDTSKVTGIGLNGMFSYCKKVKTLNLNSFVNAGLGNFISFCYNCESLEYISAQNFIWGNCNAMQGAFTNCKSLKMLDLTNFDGTTIAAANLRLVDSFNNITCPIYYNSNMCTANDTELTNKSNAIDVKGRLMAIYDFNNTETTSNNAYPVLTGSTVTKTIDTQGSESHITHRIIGVDVMPTAISFQSVTGLLNVDYLAVTSSCTSLANLFYDCIKLENVNATNWETNNVTNMNSMFRGCSFADVVGMEYWNTSKVTDMEWMFADCTSISSFQPIEQWDVSQVKRFGWFLIASSASSLDLSNWNTSNCIKMNGMFESLALTKLNVKGWNTSKVQNVEYMFNNTTTTFDLDLSSWNTSSMKTIGVMFGNWTSDQIVYVHDTNWTIDVSSYNATFVRILSKLIAKYTFDNTIGDCLPTFTGITTSDYKVSDIVNDTVTTRLLSTDSDKTITRISFGIGKTSSLLTLDYLKIDKNITAMNDMFQVCSNVTTINAQDWDTSNVTNMGYLFQGCSSLTEVIGLETWDTSKVEYMNQMFTNSKVPNVSAILNWNVSNCKSFAYMFNNANILDTELNLSNWQPNNLENCQNMFANSTFTSINLSGWNVPKLSNMSSMFASIGATLKLLSANMSNWTMETPANMNSMFYNNSNLTSIDFTGSKIVSGSLSQAFQSCSKLTTLDVSGFDTSQCTNMGLTFSLSSKLTTLTGIENWVTDKVTAMNDMFNGLTQITELNLANWDTRKVVSDNTNMFRSWTSDQTVYYEPPFWSIGTTTLNSNINWVINVTRNNGYWLDMTGITGATEITLFNENNLPTEEILTDWGDGTQNSELTHTYSTAGEYVVVSNLQLGHNNNNNNTVNRYLTKATIYYLTKPYAMFYSCSKLTGVTLTNNWVELFNTYNETGSYSCDSMFYGCMRLSTLDTTQICKMKNITSMKNMFSGCSSLVELDLGGFDSTKVTSLQSTFAGCNALKSLNLDGLDLSSVTTMASMCNNCYSLTTFTPPKNNTNSLKILQDTFRNTRLLNYDFLNDWNLDQVTSFSACLHSCAKMTSFSFKNKHLPSTTNLQYMFGGCTNLQTVDLSGLTVDNKVGMLEMFNDCKSLTSANFSNSAIKPTTCASMFRGCSSLTSLDLSSWDISQCTDMGNMFNSCSKIVSINTKGWKTDNLTITLNLFFGCYELSDCDVSHFNMSKVTIMESMFRMCRALKVIDVSNWDISSMTSMYYGFAESGVVNLDCSNLKLTDNINTNYAFLGCENMESLDISNYVKTNLDTFPFRNKNLKTIGMLYSSAEAINNFLSKLYGNKVGTTIHPDGITIYYHDADPSQLTPVEGVTFKKYVMPTTIQLPPHIQLHSFPDGTRDEVDIKTGILTRNIKQIDLNGSDESWKVWPPDSNETYTTFVCSSIIRMIVTNKKTYQLKGGNLPWYVTSDTIKHDEYIRLHNYSIYITFNNNNINSIQNLRLYLQNNPITIYEAYLEPTTEQLILNYNNSCDYGRILPTGMCDKYDVVNSMYTQTMTSILLDGANTWDAMEEFENTVKFTATGTTVGVENLNMLGAGGLYCDNDLFPNINDDSDVPHCRVDEAGNKFYIYVDKEMLMSPDLIGWQIWLQANPFNLIYELAEHLTYVKQYEELDATQARWEGMDCMRDGAIRYHTNSSDNITMYPTLEYVAPSINNFEVPMLEPNTDYTIYAEGINTNDTINLGGTDINFNNGTVYTSGDNQWLRIDNNDSFYNMVITKGDTTGEVVPYFEGMTSVENPSVKTPIVINGLLSTAQGKWESNDNFGGSVVYVPMIDVKAGQKYIIASSSKISVAVWRSKTWVNSDVTQIVMADVQPDSPLIFTPDVSQVAIFMVVAKFLTDKAHEVELRMYEGEVDYGYLGRVENPKVIIERSTVSYTDLKLRSLPNGVKDTINVVTGEYVQRVGEVVLDGSEDWKKITCNSGHMYRLLIDNVESSNWSSSEILSDKISSVAHAVRYPSTNTESDMSISSFKNYHVQGESGIAIFTNTYTWLEALLEFLNDNPITVQYKLAEPITTKLDPQTLLAYTDGTINLSSDTGLLPTTHYTVPSTNTFHLPSMKTGTRYTLKYPSASGSITIGDINYKISSDSMLFTTPLKINGDTSAIIFSDANPENVVLLEGAYNKREVPFFTGVKSVKNPNITIIDQLSTESTTYNCETEIELRGLPNGVADKLDIIKGKLTTNVGIRPYQEGDENLPNIWTDGYETVYALSSPVVKNVTIDRPTVTTNSLIELSSDYLIPQLNYRAPSSNNFPLDLLQPNQTYTLYADTLTSGSYTLGGTKTGIYSQPHTITLGDITDNLLTFNGDLGLSNVMLVKGNSLKTSLPPYFLGIRSVTDGHLLVEGMAGEMNEITFDEGIVLRDCNGVKDTIDLITCTLTKRTGEITLTGAEGWFTIPNKSVNAPDDYVVFALTLQGVDSSNKYDLICDTITSKYLYNKPHDTESIYGLNNSIRMCVKKSRIGGDTVNALKSWLNQNPTTVIYPLRPLEVQLENVWTTTPPTSYDNQTEISSTVSSTSLKPMISVTIATTTLEEIVSNLEAQNAQLEEENIATMLALTSVYETMVAPLVATTSVEPEPQATTYSMRRSVRSAEPIGMSVSPMGMVYARLVSKGFKSIDEVPYNLQAEVIYALRGME